MSRTELIKHIESLSTVEFRRVAPYLEADLESAADLAELHEQIALGRESARTEGLVPAVQVHASLQAQFRCRS